MKHTTFKFIALLLIFVLAIGALSVVSAQDDTVNLLYWQAPSSMNPYLSGGTKELESSSLVLEPLARSDPDGLFVPYLAEDIPTLENGGISEDLMTITWKLKEGLVWSDGTPVTAADAVFTWEYCTDPDTGCAQITFFDDVESVVALDDLTIQVNFSVAKPYPYGPFTTYQSPLLQAAQFADCVGINAPNCTDQNFGPIGTGPFVVEEFRANDVITFTANPNYRVAGQPGFSRLVFKGGGDAESAARAVLETGEADYAWNLQVAPAILGQMEAAGYGTVVFGFATNVERIMVNQTNPDPDLGDMRSEWVEDGSNAHPFLTDPTVWKAMSMAIDRQLLSDVGYGITGRPTCNVLPAPPIYASTANDDCLVQDIDGANAMLDAAGIVDTDGDGVREKDGVPLVVLYQTSTNAVRQNYQALIKQWWGEIGIQAELKNVDASVFFGGDPASPDTYGKFYADVEMYTNGSAGTDPEAYLSSWTCANVSGSPNNWLGPNVARWCSPAYDELATQMAATAILEERADLAKAMNDMIVQNGVLIPLVWRSSVSAHSNSIEGVRMNAWDSELWNINEWVRVDS